MFRDLYLAWRVVRAEFLYCAAPRDSARARALPLWDSCRALIVWNNAGAPLRRGVILGWLLARFAGAVVRCARAMVARAESSDMAAPAFLLLAISSVVLAYSLLFLVSR